MALPVLDASASANGGGGSNTFANILTVGSGDNRILVAALSIQDSNHINLPITAVRWGGSGGQSFTKICEKEPADNVRVEIWALLNPDTGLKDLYVATNGPVWKGVVLSSWRGAKQTLSLLSSTASGNSSSPSVNLTTGSSDCVVIDALSSESARSAVGGGQTSLGISQGQSFENVASSYETKTSPGTVTMSDTLSGGAPWAIAAIAIEPAPVVTVVKKKRFKYMIYDSAGVFKKRWTDVYSEPRFSIDLNGGFSELVVELARSVVSFGEDGDVKHGNQLKLWCFDAGSPNGVLIYSGELTRYVPSIKGRTETLKVTFLSYWQQAQRIVMEDDNVGSVVSLSYGKDYANVTPTMTANNAPSPNVVSASTEYDANHPAWKAFDGKMSVLDANAGVRPWAASTSTGWLKIDFGSGNAKQIQRYIVVSRESGYRDQMPKNWTFEGSANDSTWDVLDSRSDQIDWGDCEEREYVFENYTAYRYYRINVSANNGSVVLAIFEMKLFDGVALSRSGATMIRYRGKDPGNILKDILDRFTAAGGKIDYVTSPSDSIDTTGDTQSYTFNMGTYQEAMKKVVDMCPAGWYLRVGADDVVYLKAKNTVADHIFVLGQHISEYEPEKRTESLVNRVFFMGGDPGTGERVYKKYTRSGSVTSYGKWDRRIVDERVKLTATMDDIANRILDTFDAPEVRVVVKILDNNNEQGKGYDIESIKVGQTCKILNSTKQSENEWDVVQWDTSAWDYDITNAAAVLLQIQRIEYHPDYVVLELSNRQPDIARRVEDINQRIVDDQTKDTPAIPTT